MRRREFLGVLVVAMAATWPSPAFSQKNERPLIGVLSPISAGAAARNVEALRARLRELGYTEGRNVTLDLRFAGGIISRLPELATELVALKPAAIIAGSEPAIIAVHNATHVVPIIMSSISRDPVALKLANSLSRPGGNVTGFWIEGEQAMIGKRLEMLKEAVPGIARVGLLMNPDDGIDSHSIRALPDIQRTLSLTFRLYEAKTQGDFANAIEQAARDDMQALYVSFAPVFNNNRSEITALAMRHRLPAVYAFREFAVAGGLMSYATSLPGIYRQAAGVADKILHGTPAGEIPIERPVRFELVVNIGTAKALGLTISESFLLRADEVLE
jgi:putative ABC transport system substrate-binding protein